MKLKSTLLLFLALTTFSCKKDTEDQTPTKSFEANADGIYISNEGGFTAGKASITYSDGTEAETIQDVFRIANDENLGDVCHSMAAINGLIYLVVNNSSKIEVVQPLTMKKVKTISGLTSPRFIVKATSDKAYVSDLYSNQIAIINLTTNTVSGSINLTGSTEDMLLYNGKMYVTNLSTAFLYVIDAATDVVEDSIAIGSGGNSLQLDMNNKIWVLCGGDFVTSAPASLHRVDPSTKATELSLTFPPSVYPSQLCINETNDALFFLNTNVYKMQITDSTLPATVFVDAAGKSFYAMGYDKVSMLLYVSDAIDYQQAGRIYRYTTTGSEISGLPAGIIPGDFLFLNN